MAKEYTVNDLFHTRWEDLDPQTHAEVYALYAALPDPAAGVQYGYQLIAILRLLRKNKSLVNKITVPQAVDIFNDLHFLKQPWYYFPSILNDTLPLVRPDAELARSSFDQFIYGDNEFSQFIITRDRRYLYRLIVTLYLMAGEEYLDPEEVAPREKLMDGKLKDWQLNLVFFTFSHIRDNVMKRCKTLLPRVNVSQGDTSPQPTGPMWYKLKHQVVRTHVFGTFQETGRANMYSVLDHLEILCQENQKEHARLKAQRSRKS